MKTTVELTKEGNAHYWTGRLHGLSFPICAGGVSKFFQIPKHLQAITATLHARPPRHRDYVRLEERGVYSRVVAVDEEGVIEDEELLLSTGDVILPLLWRGFVYATIAYWVEDAE